jgi:UDP-N-acetylmuramate--alanine ligase
MEHVHLIGIGGSGLSAIARVLLESGFTVSGSDRQPSPLSRSLEEAGVRISYRHRPENVAGASLVVRSSAVQDDNVEVLTARAAGVPVLKRFDFLGRLMEGRLGIAVAGSHGKTTTTAMVAWVLVALGQDPSYIIGGVSKNLGENAHAGRGKAFVIEADEYDRMFLGLKPDLAVVTSVEHDHPDCYPTPENYHGAFLDFAGLLGSSGVLLACGDDPGAFSLGRAAMEKGIRVKFYGTGERGSDYRADEITVNTLGGSSFNFTVVGSPISQALAVLPCSLQVPGVHNVRNALAALGVAHQVGLSLEKAAQALAEFEGTGRRFDLLGEVGGITIIDDYAHHPTKIRATLSAARVRYPGRAIWAVWQPHTYSRTQAFLGAFANAFQDADHVLVTEIYAARETAPENFSTRQVVEAVRHPEVTYAANPAQAEAILLARLQPGDVLLVLSAGDADQIGHRVFETLNNGRLRPNV